MTIIAFMFVFGTFMAVTGLTLSTTAFDKGTWSHRLSNWASIAGVLTLTAALVMLLSQELGSTDANRCEDIGGVWVSNRCLDVSEFPTLPLSKD